MQPKRLAKPLAVSGVMRTDLHAESKQAAAIPVFSLYIASDKFHKLYFPGTA